MKILGIDPGLTGGLVLLNDDGTVTAKHIMPTVALKKGKMVDFFGLVDDLAYLCPDLIVCEEAWGFGSADRGGSQAAFKFGRVYQCILTCLDVYCHTHSGTRYELVTPQRWQKELFGACPKGTDKKAAALQYVQRRWPGQTWIATVRCTTPHQGLVDAGCLAEFAYRVFR
jgi:hypothetical protein